MFFVLVVVMLCFVCLFVVVFFISEAKLDSVIDNEVYKIILRSQEQKCFSKSLRYMALLRSPEVNFFKNTYISRHSRLCSAVA